MMQPTNPAALTEDCRAPVLGEDQAQTPPQVEDEEKAIDLPLEKNDADAQPGS